MSPSMGGEGGGKDKRRIGGEVGKDKARWGGWGGGEGRVGVGQTNAHQLSIIYETISLVFLSLFLMKWKRK